MPSPVTIIQLRRSRRSEGKASPVFGKVITGVITLVAVSLLGAVFVTGLVYARLVNDLPPVGNIETLFAETGNGFLEPIHVYDRSQRKLFDLLHPIAIDRQWLHVGNSGADMLPKDLQDAIVSFHDKSFWTNQGYDLGYLVSSLFHGGSKDMKSGLSRSITQRLVEMTILPSEDFLRSDLWRYLREALLAERLTENYSKDQILEWYINSVGYGNLAYGADAAALVYFGKHAPELTLAESALLAAISMDPKYNPLDMTGNAQEGPRLVLQAMLDSGLITELQSHQALLEDVVLSDQSATRDTQLQRYTWDRITAAFGTDIANRAGLHVFTTIDVELQLQLGCAVEIHVNRLSGKDFNSAEVLPEGEECSASGLLPPLRPGEENLEYDIGEVASVIIDARNGEILSFYGPVDKPMPSTSILYPFIYLAAFSRGNSPGTMVLDLPLDTQEGQGFMGATSHGPISMRTALVEGYPFAAQRIIQSIGLEAVLQVVEQMGVSDIQYTTDMLPGTVFPERYEISLLNAAYGYGILANTGKMIGTPRLQTSEEAWRSLDPILIQEVKDQAGTTLYEGDMGERLIVTQELAFMITDVLKDTAESWPVYGQSNIFEADRPSAVTSGIDQDGKLSWTIGYTPSRVVGVWLENRSGEENENLNELTGAPAPWHALMEYVTETLPPEGWQQPSGIVQVEICETSGLLPTSYCPSVIKEYFIEATVPIHYDTLYKPFRVNRETGKLATLFTPLDLMIEQVFFVPPPEALEWAREAGYLQPPNEYDTLTISASTENNVKIDIPKSFDYVQGKKWISGRTKVEGFRYYRLLYGEGLNPTHWYQIGENHYKRVVGGTLALWDTTQLDGLYALQLVVVDQDGIAHIDTRYVTVDNQIPEIDLLCPESGDVKHRDQDQQFSCDVRVSDNIEISKVEFYLNEVKISSDFTSPFTIRMDADVLLKGMLYARAYDLAGNRSESEAILIPVMNAQ